MRNACALLSLALIATLAAGEAPAPRLRALGEDWEAVNHALIRLRQGDVDALAGLPAAVFLEPLAAADDAAEAGDEPPLRAWTMALPRVIVALPEAARARALATLDACYRGRAALGDVPRPALAARFLPAPSALIDLALERDRAFDHGDLRRCLAIDALIGACEAVVPTRSVDRRDRVAAAITASVDAERRDAALALTGDCARVDASLALGEPGVPEPAEPAAPATDREAGLTVTWRRAPGALIALDPWGRPLWQHALERDARVVTGPGGAIVLGTGGLRLVAEDGAMVTAPSPPARTRALAVGGGGAWFAAGATAYRVDLVSGERTTIALPAEPLAPPLVRGVASLWLTADQLVLARGAPIAAHVFHGLPVDDAWRVAADREGVLLAAPDGRAWRCPALARELARATPEARVRLHAASGDWQRVLAEADATPAVDADAETHAAIVGAACHAVAAADGADDAVARALTHARDAGERARVRWQAWLARGARAVGDALAGDLAAAPDALELPAAEAAPEAPAASWRHALGAAGARRVIAAAAAPAWPQAIDPARPVVDDAVADAAAPAARSASGGAYRGALVVLEHGAGWTEARLKAADGGALLWRHRWTAPTMATAPSRAWACVDDRLLVAEGASRLVVLDLGDGARLGHVDLAACDAVPAQAVALRAAPLVVAVLQPIGVDRAVTFASAAGETTVALPARARWLVPLPGGRVLVALADGSCWAYAADAPPIAARIPQDLGEGAAPVATAAGLARDGRCWAWRAGDAK